MNKNPWINYSDYARGLWICMIILHFQQAFEHALVQNKPGFWIWYCCICKGYTKFQMFLIMAPYTSIMPEYASIYLSAPQYAWTWLNLAECSGTCTLSAMPGSPVCNIVLVTYVILLVIHLYRGFYDLYIGCSAIILSFLAWVRT